MAKSKQNSSVETIELPVITKKKFHIHLSVFKKKAVYIPLTLVVIIVISVFSGWLLMYNRFYPGTSIAGTSISFLTKEEAKQKILYELSKRTEKPIFFSIDNTQKQITIDKSTITTAINNEVDQAFELTHQPSHPIFGNNQTLDLSQDPNLLYQVNQLSESVNQPPIDAQLSIDADQITVTPSQDGTVLNQSKLLNQINEYINTGNLSQNQIPMIAAGPKLSFETAVEIKRRLDQIRLSPLILFYKDSNFPLDLPTLLSLIDFENSQTHLASGELNNNHFEISTIRVGDETFADAKLIINPEKATAYFNTIAKQIDTEVQEPLFNYDPQAPENSRVQEFKPPVEGQTLLVDEAVNRLSQALLTQHQTKMELPVKVTTPKNKLANELGVKELVGEGHSNFAGSIENRIYNVRLGASKINGVLIPPGEVFSFTQTVGDITAATGFKQAYVIKSGRTVLDDGGGICQVSTTLFRAALDAGLPIVNRTAHAYRVGYYEQGFGPGIDATVFYPSVDFQFKNDTPNHLLIQTSVVGTSLTINLYGTSDGRITTLTKPVILNQTPPPPEIRQDDPTLPRGTVKQVDFAAWGANVSFSRKVERNGQIISNDTFKSNYRPWQAVFLVGTKDG